MTRRMLVALGLTAGLFAADPGYLSVTFAKTKLGRQAAAQDFHKKVDAHLDPLGAEPGGRFLRLRRAYPIGSEHGYNRMFLTFRPEPPELDVSKRDPARNLGAFLKASGMTSDQYSSWYESIFDGEAARGRLYREVASLGRIEKGDWIRVNWIRAAPGKRQALREANAKYLRTAATKRIARQEEKAWLFFELTFTTSEDDYDFLRVLVFKNSKAAQQMFSTPLSEILDGSDYAKLTETTRGATAATRVEIFQVEHVREGK